LEMADIHGTEYDRLRGALQSFRQLGPTAQGGDNTLLDASILGITTVQSFIDVINGLPRKDSESPLRHREAIEFIQEMGDRGIFTTGNLTAADTFAGVVAIITAVLPAVDGEVQASYYGGQQYLGNGGPLSTT
jgi:hypothetical protein